MKRKLKILIQTKNFSKIIVIHVMQQMNQKIQMNLEYLLISNEFQIFLI